MSDSFLPFFNSIIAADDKPNTLPVATTRAIEEAAARGEYLEEVDCYWAPTEAEELRKFFLKITGGSLNDYRKRHRQILVAHLPSKLEHIVKLEALIKENREQFAVANSFKIDYQLIAEYTSGKFINNKLTYGKLVNGQYIHIDTSDIPKCERLLEERNDGVSSEVYDELQRIINNKRLIAKINTDYNGLDTTLRQNKNEVAATKAWKPVRRITVTMSYNDHGTEKLIQNLTEISKECPNIAPKIIEVVKMRKAAMAEMNKRRGNPMRNVHLEIALTSMDFCVRATWTIHRESEDGGWGWTYWTHFLHGTEYNLMGETAVEFKSREKQMTEEENAAIVANVARLKELKKLAHENYFVIYKYEISKATKVCIKKEGNCSTYRETFKDEQFINDEDLEEFTNSKGETHKYNPISQYIVTNVNHEAQTFDIVGYITKKDDGVKKSKITQTIQYPAKNKRAKQSPMEKDLKKLTQNYDIAPLQERPKMTIERLRRIRELAAQLRAHNEAAASE